MNFFRVLFLAFLIVPIIEMAVLIEVGGMIGAIKTIGLVMLTAVIGVWLLRLQGLQPYGACGQNWRRGSFLTPS